MNHIISPCWYGVCDTCIEEEVLMWIRLYHDYNRSLHPTIPPIHIVTQQSRPLHRDEQSCHDGWRIYPWSARTDV